MGAALLLGQLILFETSLFLLIACKQNVAVCHCASGSPLGKLQHCNQTALGGAVGRKWRIAWPYAAQRFFGLYGCQNGPTDDLRKWLNRRLYMCIIEEMTGCPINVR